MKIKMRAGKFEAFPPAVYLFIANLNNIISQKAKYSVFKY
jgi:hypothetical protein